MLRLRSGFARLLPLMAFPGLAAGTIALLASAQPVPAPAHPSVIEVSTQPAPSASPAAPMNSPGRGAQ